MARAQLEYDESGSTFYYFLISFYGIVLLPVTYFLWPRKDDDGKGKGLVCQCEPCQMKRVRLDTERPKKRLKNFVKYLVLLVLWALLFLMIYKVLTLEKDYIEYDPFEILQLDPGASVAQIKKKYRQLSKVYHPDKEGGDQDMFMKIAKAYEALTDEEARDNWVKYGNPDGPQAATFGIALPSWIVSEKNSIWLLVLYISVFVFGLPVIVGVWWYSSIKYGTTNILIQTSQLFFYFFSRNKTIPIKRVVAVLTCAAEFNPQSSPVIKVRPSDNVELPEIIKAKVLPHVDVKTKERPFCAGYAVKARILAHSHLEGYQGLSQNALKQDQYALLKRCPQLIQEILNLLGQVWYLGKSRRGTVPSLETFENVMKVSQMLVQGMWSRGNNCLYQMPHITAEQVRHFRTKKRNITTIEQFVAMKRDDRRSLVRSLSDEEYADVMAMCSMLPHVDIEAETQVVDDTDHDRITAGSLVTVSVVLYRTSLIEHCGISLEDLKEELSADQGKETTPTPDAEDEDLGEMVVETVASGDLDNMALVKRAEGVAAGSPQPSSQKIKTWEKTKRKKKGKGGAAGPSKNKKKAQQKKAGKKTANGGNALQERTEEGERNKEDKERWESENEGDGLDREEDEEEEIKVENKQSRRNKKEGGREKGGKNSKLRHRTTATGSNKKSSSVREDQSSDDEDGDERETREGKDDEEEWKKLQESMQKHQKKKFDSINTKSFPVHAPLFPEEKQECWWLFVSDRKRKEVITPPQRITGLREKHSTDIQFPAPEKPGLLRYTVCLVSDSYIDMMFYVDLKLTVEEKQEVKGTDQWKDLEEEEEEEEVIEESEEESEEFSETDTDD